MSRRKAEARRKRRVSERIAKERREKRVERLKKRSEDAPSGDGVVGQQDGVDLGELVGLAMKREREREKALGLLNKSEGSDGAGGEPIEAEHGDETAGPVSKRPTVADAEVASKPKPPKVHAKPDANWQKLKALIAAETNGTKKRQRKSLQVHPTERQENKDVRSGVGAVPATPTKVVAIDCEMVGVGVDARESALARVSVVNYHGEVLYNTFVKPKEKVTDYRTPYSGVRPRDVWSDQAASFADAQKQVHALIRQCILVGHSLGHDLEALLLSHPRRDIRDVGSHKVLRERLGPGSGKASLKRMAAEILGLEIQRGEHDSVEDARAAMALYRHVAKEWEQSRFRGAAAK